MDTCGTYALRMRLSGSAGLSPALEAGDRGGRESKTVLERTRDGDPRPAGEMDLEPGGDSVDAYSEALEGLERRKGREVSELGNDSMVDVECRVLGNFMVEAAMGNAWSGSVGGFSSSKGCGMKATSGRVESWGVVCDAAEGRADSRCARGRGREVAD